ncbi:MAG: sulfotransferase domain-containing protein [Erythrobacter sp.]|nr:MAG: sulfotransferase domain-containing protein [Erythrobacter sp.]
MNPQIARAIRNPVWAAEKAWLWGRSIAGLRASDKVFAFYPKTGSTWVRIFFYNLLAAREMGRAGDFSFDAVDASMPEFANPSFFKPWPFRSSDRILKTHRPYNRVWAGRPSVLFTREPRDTMVSFLHYANAKKEFGFAGDLNDLVRHPEFGLDSYMRFYTSWKPHAGLIIRYEDLRAEPLQEFTRIVGHIGIDADLAEITSALEASTLERTRKAQEQSSEQFRSKFKDGFVFARKGASGEGQEAFDEELEAYYLERRAAWGFDLYA